MPAYRFYKTWHQRLHSWAADRRGASAVEFALIAFPLIFMIFCCLELAFIILLSVSLDNATDLAARQIRTGILTQGNSSAASFRQKICGNISWLEGACNAALKVDVQTYESFAQVPTTDLIKNGEFDTANFAYVIGSGSKIQMVRAYYEWPMFTPFLQGGVNSLSNKNVVVTAKVVFRNEPF
jgi:Flp pilus assembly protein TadG